MVQHQQSSNKLRFILAGFLVLIFALPLSAQAGVFNAESFTLENGLEVIVIANTRAPVVTHMVWYKVGAADEPQGLSGMAHYFEHLMFKGTKTVEPGAFSKLVKKLGGNDNAFTGQDYTAYFQTISVQHLEKMMQMEADRMVNLAPPPTHFDSEKKVVLEERRERTENDPKGLFAEQMRSALFVNHPYSTPVIGWMEEIKSYEWNDVKKFYDKWYAPNNAIVIISGDVTAKTVRPMIERTYGALKPGALKPKELPARIRPDVPPAIGQTTMSLEHSSIHQPGLRQIFLAPVYHQNKPDSLALEVLQEIMSGGPTTRLYKNLVVDQKKVISANLSYSGGALDNGTLGLSGTPAENVTLEELEGLIHIEIQKIITTGVTEIELKEAIQRLQDAAIYARDSLSGPAMTFGHTLTTGGTIDDVENWPENIALVTAAQVQGVAKKYLDINNPWKRPPITGHLLPKKLIKSGVEKQESKE